MMDLRLPIRSEKVRYGCHPHWRTVFVYRCHICGNETRVFANSFTGENPTPEVGGVYCNCELKESEGKK